MIENVFSFYSTLVLLYQRNATPNLYFNNEELGAAIYQLMTLY